MTGTVNALASTVLTIRNGSTSSFQAGFDQLAREEQIRILNDINFLSASNKLVQQGPPSIRQNDE